jgi:cation:H+ antiporter
MLVYLFFAVGLGLLLLGGEWLVRGAVGLAKSLHIPPLIIGLTIVAFGTSAPELIVSLRAALGGNGGLSLGNVVGSNIANVLLVLGLPALLSPIICHGVGMRTNVSILVLATVLFMFMVSFGSLTRLDGIILVGVLIAFLVFQFFQARSQKEMQKQIAAAEEIDSAPQNLLVTAAFLVAGFVALPVAAELTVQSAVTIAEIWEVPDHIIGLTIVAIGTSLPELATAIMAARAKSTSVLLGSLIGSNFFNLAAILGITAIVVPIPASDHILDFDIWVMAGATLLLVLLATMRLTIGKVLGAAMFGSFLLYLVATVSL